MKCDKWLHIYGNKLGTAVKCEWVDDVRENVRARWIEPSEKVYTRDGHDTTFIFAECSSCHETFPKINGMYFCPNCGADMRGDNND